jgi:hypothetical protein
MPKSAFVSLFMLAVVFLLPGWARVHSAYQNSLWTAKTDPHHGSGWQWDNGVKVHGKDEWQRLRLGFPLKATTIDSNVATGARQVRVEIGALAANLLLWLLCFSAFVFATGITSRLSRRKPLHPEES